MTLLQAEGVAQEEALALQTQQPELGPPAPHTAVHTCNLVAGEAETGSLMVWPNG